MAIAVADICIAHTEIAHLIILRCCIVFQSPDSVGTECVMLLGGHKTPVVSVDWSASADTMTCLTASMDGKVRVSTLLAR